MENNVIDSFSGKYFFLSNFYPCQVMYGPDVYSSTEHGYVAAKTTNPKYRSKIQKLETPRESKRFGRELTLSEDWDGMKLDVMEFLLRQKFKNGTRLAERLMETYGHELIEGNTWGDTFWGTCNGKGENHLGKLLMKIRHELLMENSDGS